MKRFRITETYLKKVWIKQTYECDAKNEDDAYAGEIDNILLIEEEEVESEHGDWCEIDECHEI